MIRLYRSISDNPGLLYGPVSNEDGLSGITPTNCFDHVYSLYEMFKLKCFRTYHDNNVAARWLDQIAGD